MSRLWLLPLLVFAVLVGAPASAEPLVRVAIQGDQPVSVGQQVRIDVQVLVPNFFMSAPRFPIFDLPGTIVTMPDESGLNINDTIDGQTYAGIQKTYVITPQQAGTFILPPARIPFTYAAVPGQPTDGFVVLPPQTLTVKLPAGAENGGVALPVAKVTISQTLDREPTGLKVGDSLIRTVSIFAEKTQAMMIPPPQFEAPAGVRIYPQAPVLTDESKDRVGFVGGHRTDRVTYVFERRGDYVLPAIDIDWFDAATRTRQTARAPEIRLTILAGATPAAEIAPDVPHDVSSMMAHVDWIFWLSSIGGMAAVVLGLGWAFWRYEEPGRAWLAKQRRKHRESEAASFARVRRACTAADGSAAYVALGLWARRTDAGSLAVWVAQAGEPALRSEIDLLERALFGRPSPTAAWNGPRLALLLTRARSQRRVRLRSRAAAPSSLPMLNP